MTPPTKTCIVCRLEKSRTCFNKKGSTRTEHRSAKCYTCAYQRRSRRLTPILVSAIRSAKAKPCMDCGVSYPFYVMDFDHRPGTTKRCNLSRAVKKFSSLRMLEDEMAKCDVVCANCHRVRTYQRMEPRPPGA